MAPLCRRTFVLSKASAFILKTYSAISSLLSVVFVAFQLTLYFFTKPPDIQEPDDDTWAAGSGSTDYPTSTLTAISMPRIVFPFIPGNAPLSNGVSGLPDFDDIYYDDVTMTDVHDAPRDVPFPFPAQDLSMEPVESIFEDLLASCGSTCDLDDFAPSPPPQPFRALPAESPASILHAVPLTDATDDCDSSDDEDESDMDSDDEFDTSIQAVCEARDARDAAVIAARLASSPLRSISPLSDSSIPFSSPSSPSHSTIWSDSDTSDSDMSAFSEEPSAAGVLVDLDAIVDNEDLERPDNSDGIKAKYWWLLVVGCGRVGEKGLSCYGPDIRVKPTRGPMRVEKCGQMTGNSADMARHVRRHFRQYFELRCHGCPQRFSRDSSLKRHLKPTTPAHFTETRRRLLVQFNQRPDVIRMRAELPADATAVEKGRLNTQLNQLFDDALAALP
ncbi:hypothetical protein DFH06DRAFT_1468772 [Mycena polygramma]|nr:hypothetical protein DFH06DRAFT_1468772 [Mycena polygramma]